MGTNKDGKLPTAIQAKWNAAGAQPGVPVDLGDIVVCDYCSTDYRGKSDSGGFIFCSNAVCPSCAQGFEKNARKHQEEHLIRARCPSGQSFHQFVLDYRHATGSNSLTIRVGDDTVAILKTPAEMKTAAQWWHHQMSDEQQFRLLDTTHTHGCNCDQCLSWWALMGPDGDEPGDYGPFTKEQVNARQREIGVKETA